MNQLEKLLQRRSEINNNIIKGFLSDEEIDFIEKASRRAVGEAHPNGKWVWTDLGNGKYNWRVPKGKGAAAGSSDDSNKKKEENADGKGERGDVNIDVKQIFNDIQALNPQTSTVSSIGTFVSSQQKQMADNKLREIIKYLPKESLAYKIISASNGRFSDKQLWVIAYELMKNEKYKKDLSENIEEFEEYINYQKARKAAKRAAKKQRTEQYSLSRNINIATQNKIVDNDKNNHEKVIPKETSKLKVGDKVKHNRFGEGEILLSENGKVRVLFKDEERLLLEKYANLQKI